MSTTIENNFNTFQSSEIFACIKYLETKGFVCNSSGETRKIFDLCKKHFKEINDRLANVFKKLHFELDTYFLVDLFKDKGFMEEYEHKAYFENLKLKVHKTRQLNINDAFLLVLLYQEYEIRYKQLGEQIVFIDKETLFDKFVNFELSDENHSLAERHFSISINKLIDHGLIKEDKETERYEILQVIYILTSFDWFKELLAEIQHKINQVKN